MSVGGLGDVVGVDRPQRELLAVGQLVVGAVGLVGAATTTRPTPARRHASSTVHVPRMLASKVETGERLATPTIVCAARWKTVSTSYSPSARSISARIADVAMHDVDRRSVPSQRQRGHGDRVALEHRHARAALQQRLDQPASEQAVGPVTNTERPVNALVPLTGIADPQSVVQPLLQRGRDRTGTPIKAVDAPAENP